MLLYHLDRGHSLKEGMQINLKNGSQALSNVENSLSTVYLQMDFHSLVLIYYVVHVL